MAITFFGRNWIDWGFNPIDYDTYLKDRKAGSLFFGIDAAYIAKVQRKEIFELVAFGFSHESLMKMSIEDRRYYFHLLIERNSPKEE